MRFKWQWGLLAGAYLAIGPGCSDTPTDDDGTTQPSPGGETSTPGDSNTPGTATPGSSTPGIDQDGDGYTADEDCDDADDTVHPGAEDVPYDGIDQDCSDGDLADVDADGYDAEDAGGDDCDDADDEIHPGADEVPYDGVDQDCDDEDLVDVDADGAPGTDTGNGDPLDCDDEDPARSPAFEEVPYDGIDNDCDGVDLKDVDGDGYDATQASGDDCDDEDPDSYPGATETPYDSIDQDCSGADLTDVDGDGYKATQAGGDDCDDDNVNTYPGAPEFADNLDNDCDGVADDGLDTSDDDGDTYSEAAGDCNDGDSSIHPGATDVPYDDVDQDCSGLDLDDVDGDGASGDPGEGGPADCDDQDDTVYPGADEVPYDAVDQDCSGADLIDVDQDSYASTQAGGTDCDDGTATTHPGATDVPYDAVDQDCSGADLTDVDGDGASSTQVSGGTDCDDQDADIGPDADELCDGIDNNCDSVVDTDAIDRKTYYVDGDGDGYGDPGQSVQACAPSAGQVSTAGDCNDSSSSSYPGAAESCDGADNDCDGAVDDGVTTTYYLDLDGDGYGDKNATAQACSQPSGYASDSTDCNDASASAYPGATETCNLADDDCDSSIDEDVQNTYYQDSDGDGYGNPAKSVTACTAPSGYVANSSDCKDTNDAAYPGATELCNNADDDCDGSVDEGAKLTWYRDADGDGYGDKNNSTQSCTQPTGYVGNDKDCNDQSASVKPGAIETCNGLDDDCDTQADEGVTTTYYKDSDGDGYGNASVTQKTCSQPTGYTTNGTDCDDANNTIHPGATETCNSVDDDCDTQVDEGVKLTWYKDADGDGYGAASSSTQACSQPTGYVANDKDCNDAKNTVYPGATESCNSVDDDCDGSVDEGVTTTYYQDADKDTYGNPSVTTQACSQPSGYVTNNKDCADTNDTINPGATETLNSIDDDCDGQVDEGVYYTSCLTLKNAQPSASSGVYTIDPDGTGSVSPFEVYCDMSNNGGGWTLVLKVNGAAQTFTYDSSYWTTGTTYSPTSTAFDTNEAKLNSYNTVAFTSVMVGMLDSGTVRFKTIGVSAASMLALIGSGANTSTAIGRDAWKGLMASPSLQPYCNNEGFNVVCGGDTKIRIGITSNQENDCGSCDSRIGIGGYGSYCGQDAGNTAGNEATCSPDNGDRHTKAFGYVFVR